MKQAKKWANYYGVACQLIAGASETNCKAVLVNGMQFKTSNLTGTGFQELFEKLACGQKADACSVAKQMINEAHGRSRNESLKNFMGQDMTYADPYANIQFAGRTLTDVFNQLIKRETTSGLYDVNEVSNWIKTMIDWHGANAKAVVKQMITNKEVRIYDRHVISNKIFLMCIDKWVSENNQQAMGNIKKNAIIDLFLNRLEGLE